MSRYADDMFEVPRSALRVAGARSRYHKYNVLVRSKTYGARFTKVATLLARSPTAAAKAYVHKMRSKLYNRAIRKWQKSKKAKKGSGVKAPSLKGTVFPHHHLFVARVGKHKYATYFVPAFGLSGIHRLKSICKSTKKDLVARLTGKKTKSCEKKKKTAVAAYTRPAPLKKRKSRKSKVAAAPVRRSVRISRLAAKKKK
jgi:hypothetical protein